MASEKCVRRGAVVSKLGLGTAAVPRKEHSAMADHYQPTTIRRRQIAEAALAVIAEGGLGAFTTRAIAARLEITDGTIFRHFANKQEIVQAAMERLEEELFIPLEPGEDGWSALESLFRRRARLLGGPEAIGRLVFSEQLVHAGGEAGLEKFRAWRRRTQHLVESQLDALRASGRARSDLPLATMVRLFLGTMITFSNERVAFGGPLEDLDAKIDAAWAGLRVVLSAPEAS